MRKLTLEQYIEKASLIHNGKYDYSKVDYINSDTKICIICPEHGEFWQRANDHLRGIGCKKCGHVKKGLNKRYTTQDFIEIASKVDNNKYNYSKAVYTKSTDKISIICPIHGEFKQEANSHMQGRGCPKCNLGMLDNKISKREKLIESLLSSYNIKFIQQYEIPINTSINKSGKAYIDFYLPDMNLMIEYNGEQHYIPKKFFGGELAFKRQCFRDNYVRNYCQDKGIKLIEIHYKTSNEEIKNIIKSIAL